MALGLTVTSAISVPAQEADIEVVVTATRVETPEGELPASTSVLTRQDIQASGAGSVVEVLERLPQLSFPSYTNESQAGVRMRGFSSVGRVLVLVDGRRINRPDLSDVNWLAIPLENIERIEVISGPAAAAYGNNAVAGVINVITARPESPIEVAGSLQLGSNNENRQALRLGHGAGWGSIDAGIERYATDGHRDRSAFSSTNFNLNVDLLALEGIELGLGGSYGTTSFELPGSLSPSQFENDPTQAVNQEDGGADESLSADLRIAWAGTELLQAEVITDITSLSVDNDTASFSSWTTRDLTSYGVSPALIAEWGIGAVPIRTRVGADWRYARQDKTSYSGADRSGETSNSALWQSLLGVSLSSQIALSEQLVAEGALRFDQSTIGAEKESAGIDEDITHQATVFDAGLVYQPLPPLRAYLRAATLFRYPAIDEQADLNFADQFENDLDPEEGISVETGGSVSVGGALVVNLGFYWLEMREEIQYVYDAVTFQGSNQNIGSTRRLGADLRGEFLVPGLLEVNGGYSFVDARFTDGENDGNQVPLSAAHRAKGEAAIIAIDNLAFGPRVTVTGAQFADGDEANTRDAVDAVTVTDLFVRFQPAAIPGAVSVVGEVSNVFDVRYAPVQLDYGTRSYYPAPGRRWSLSASYRY